MTARKQRIIAPNVTEPPPRLWSNCLAVGNTVYLAGLTAFDFATMKVVGNDEYAQARAVFATMRSLLGAAGGTMDDIVQLRIYVTDISKNTEIWRARQEFFSGDFPACALVEVKALTQPDLLVEIEAVAHLGCGSTAL